MQDSTFVYASYAAVFLLKLASPTFASFINEEAATRLVRELSETLEEAAVDEQHTPYLCAYRNSLFCGLGHRWLTGPACR